MRTEEQIIRINEYVYTEAEQKRMIEIKYEIRKLLTIPDYNEQILIDLLEELESIFNNEWSEPLPF